LEKFEKSVAQMMLRNCILMKGLLSDPSALMNS